MYRLSIHCSKTRKKCTKSASTKNEWLVWRCSLQPGKAIIVEVDSDEEDDCVSSPATKTGKAMERERRIQQAASSALARRAAIASEAARRKEAKEAKRRSRAEFKAAKVGIGIECTFKC